MHTAVRPFTSVGVSLVGATAIAMAPVLSPTVAAQLHSAQTQIEHAAVQLAAAASPQSVYNDVYQAALTNIQGILTTQLANPTPILTAALKTQIAALQSLLKVAAAPGTLVDATGHPGVPFTDAPGLVTALGTAAQQVFTNVTTLVPPLLQSALDNLLQGNVEEANNQVLLATMTAIIPLTDVLPSLVNSIAHPLQDVVSAMSAFGPVAAIMVNPLQNVVNVLNTLNQPYSGLPVSNATFVVGGLIGPLIEAPAALGAGVQHIIDAAGTGDLGNVVNAMLTLPATVIGGILNGGYGPDLSSVIDSGIPGVPLYANGLLGSFNLVTDPNVPTWGFHVTLPGPVSALQTLGNLIAGALKAPKVAAAPAALAAGATAANAVPELTAKSLTVQTATVDAPAAADSSAPSADSKDGGKHRRHGSWTTHGQSATPAASRHDAAPSAQSDNSGHGKDGNHANGGHAKGGNHANGGHAKGGNHAGHGRHSK